LYRPIDRISMPTVFATLHVYENRPNFNLHPPGSRKILETDKYVFIFESVSRNNFTDPVDRAAFDQHISSAANDAMMAGQIDVPGSERIIPTNTVNVNGRVLRNHAVRGAAGTIYIPVREASNMLGYTVAWSAATNVVTLNSPERNHTVTINLNPGADRYSTIIINDRSFISTAFFMRELNANIEVDGNNNVIITTTVR
ncbi:MAG: copper amine oxidase N-terminal domain-containing protein, partial [Defluviitaleaceae bacterium]|nr:copper amine oxidase N-terminal domain-containing protein [Defluviitaleaceae bacterium]